MKINLNNYEEWMVAFLDNELSVEEVAVFEKFLKKHPELKAELAAYETINFGSDEQIIFDDKELLYKKASTFLLLKKAWPMAAAVLILLALIPFFKSDGPKVQNKIVEKGNTQSVIEKQQADSATAEIVAETFTQETTESTLPQPAKPSSSNEKSAATTPTKTIASNVKNANKTNQVVKDVVVVAPLPEVIITKTQVVESPQPKAIVKGDNLRSQEVEYNNSLPKENEKKGFTQKRIQESVEGKEKGHSLIVSISSKDHPIFQGKIDEVVSKVEGNIEKIKEIKDAPITVCIGKLKLFTINNAQGAQAN